MSRQSFHLSDISGEVIRNTEDVVQLIVHEHGLIEEPVKLDISAKEAANLDLLPEDFVILEMVEHDGTSTRAVMKQQVFDAMFTHLAVDQVLADAAPLALPKKAARSGASIDYTQPDTFGIIHKGTISETEKQMVRDNVEQASENRRRVGQPAIVVTDAKEIKRYGFTAV